MATTNIDIKLAQIEQLDAKELTEGKVSGTGVFDVLMAAANLHIREEYAKGRITGPEYSQVYLGGLQATLSTSVEYLTRSKTLGIEIANQEKQGLLTEAQTDLVKAQANQITLEVTTKLPAEVENIKASTALTGVNKDKVQEELTLIPLQGNLLTAQTGQVGAETVLTEKRVDQITAELAKIPVEVELLQKQVTNATTQNELLVSQVEGSDLQNSKVPKEIAILEKQALQQEAATALTTTQKDQLVYDLANKSPIEVDNLTKQGLNLTEQVLLTKANTAQTLEQTKRIPYDIEEIQSRIANMSKQNLLLEKDYELRIGQLELQQKQLLLSEAELEVKRQEIQVQLAAIQSQKAQADLYAQKVQTERAQIEGNVAQPGSVLGANVAVLMAQADGYKSDRLQKTTKILVDTWNVRRNSDDGTEANVQNQLHDVNIGVAVSGLMVDSGLTPNTSGS